MGIEIEHKYLVKDDSFKEMSASCRHIRQGYLNREIDRTIRIRTIDDKGYITVKGRNHGDRRMEFEYAIPVSDALAMLEMCEGRILEKNRYIVDYKGFKWEIDEFLGDLSPLTVAEIELPESTHNYPLPPFIGEEVTGRPEYYNSML